MVANPPGISSKDGTQMVSKGGRPARNCRKSRYAVDEGGDLIECSGKHCQSCVSGLIADCVALCCCPCALVNIFALAFVKVPLMVGRRCLGVGKKKRKKLELKRKCKKSSEIDMGNSRERMTDEIISEIAVGFGVREEEIGVDSARLEAERVWLELHQVGHHGFGRFSCNDRVILIRDEN